MSLKDEFEVVRQIPLLAKLDPARLKLLAFASDRLTYSAGDYLFLQGDSCDGAYIVLEGEAEVLVGDAETLVATIGPNNITGEIALICDKPRTASVRAKGPLTALRIPKDVFLPMLTEFPEMAMHIAVELALRLERTTRQLVEKTTSDTSRPAD